MDAPRTADYHAGEIKEEAVRAFSGATHSSSIKGVPPTFLTLFRESEYVLINALGVNWNYLLHGDQEYEYYRELKVGDVLDVKSRVADVKERVRRTEKMQFVKMESDFLVGEEKVATARSTFIIREPIEDGK